jgi:hypothetical protein
MTRRRIDSVSRRDASIKETTIITALGAPVEASGAFNANVGAADVEFEIQNFETPRRQKKNLLPFPTCTIQFSEGAGFLGVRNDCSGKR